ncbi:MAG TPA: hypothetical protein VET88_11790 [Gammaproteobacteria bacterium]|nr:hypothetical protein [Gammaproteobacteria bacterium]
MKKVISAVAAGLLVFGSQGAMAGACEPDQDPDRLVSINTTQLYFNSTNTLGSVSVRNNGIEPMTITTTLPGNTTWFSTSGCEGVVLDTGDFCTVTVNFLPSGPKPIYKRMMFVSGETATGNYDQRICFEGTNP